MKGRWLFFSALQAASQGISHTPRPPHRQFHSHTVAVRATGLFDNSFTCTIASPFHNDLDILHRCISFSTAAAQRIRIICDKDEEARIPFVGLLATKQNQKQDEEARAPTTKPKQKQDEVQARAPFLGLPATKPNQKPRVVVLGTGWGACRLLKELDTGRYDVVCISPRNHMVFTPLLASTCVGTLEFRSVAEPVRIIQPALAKDPDSYFFLARCTDIDTASHEVHCESVDDQSPSTTATFRIAYDKLVIATGAEATTFGIQGVHEYAIFLRDVQNAMAIRSKLMLNLMRCEIPGTDLQERKRLLHCVVVGGGPTGVEFSGELSDFILNDVQNKFAHVKDLIAVTLIEASDILSSFDIKLRQYATNHLTKSGVKLKRGVVKHVLATKLVLTDGTEVPYGLLVWSTGVGPSQFVKSLKQFEKSKNGRIGIDLTLRVPAHADVYAIGDCSGYLEGTGKTPLPALAQVAERHGKYLARALNKLGESGHARAGSGAPVGDPFVYKHLGSMATVGRYKALVDLRESPEKSGLSMTGFKSWLVWRSAYLTRVISWRARMYVAFNWGTTLLFGRDISRF